MKIKKIYVVAAVHGDEPFGLKVMAHLLYLADPRIVTRVAHPEAVAKRKEFLEANLNRCFGTNAPDSKEARIAQHILRDIESHQPDLIIDVHTCESKVGKSAIIPKIGKPLIDVAKKLGADYIFENIPEIAPNNLIGQKPDRAILLELGRGLRSDQLAHSMAVKITNLLKNEPVPERNIKVYSKTRCIGKSEAIGLKLQNYVFNKKLGGYPYLVGKNTYGKHFDYVGFLAKKATKL